MSGEAEPATGAGEAPVAAGDARGATIQLWRAPSRVWPAFPTLSLVRAVSRLFGGRDTRGHHLASGRVTVILDGSNVGTISPDEVKVYRVTAGEHSLGLHFLGGLRRSRGLHVALAEGEEKHLVCSLNGWAWPTVRIATPEDTAATKPWKPPAT